MRVIKVEYDINQEVKFGNISKNHKPVLRATMFPASVTNSTILMLLAGINITATMGERLALTAKESPTTL